MRKEQTKTEGVGRMKRNGKKRKTQPQHFKAFCLGGKKGASTRTPVQPENVVQSLRQKENPLNKARPRRLSAQACLEKIMFIQV